MWKIYANDELLYQANGNFRQQLYNITLTLKLNSCGSLKFTVPPQNAKYSSLTVLSTMVDCRQDDVSIWRGRIVSATRNITNELVVECEGELAYLGDVVKGAYSAKYTASGWLSYFLGKYNDKCSEERKIEVGQCTVMQTTAAFSLKNESPSTILDELNSLVNTYGGYLRIRLVDGTRYLDWIESYGTTAAQKINFGRNLMDFAEETSVSDLYTIMYPVGKTSAGKIIEVKKANGGDQFVRDKAAIAIYGNIYKTVEIDQYTPAKILAKAKTIMDARSLAVKSISCSAIDLKDLGADTEHFALGDMVNVVSAPHALDADFLLSQIEYKIPQTEDTKYTLGHTSSTLTASLANGGSAQSYEESVEDANELIHSIAHRGYHVVAPENTIAAFNAARDADFLYIESDIAYTSDREPVLIHDAKVDRTTDGTGKVADMTLAQILKLDAGSWRGSTYAGQRIPRFSDLCTWLKDNPKENAMVELKTSVTMSVSEIKALVTAAKSAGVLSQLTFFASRSAGAGECERLKAVKSADSTARIGVMFDPTTGLSTKLDEVVALRSGENEVIAYLDYTTLTADIVNAIEERDIPLEVFTMDSRETILSTYSYISGIASNLYHAGKVMLGIDDDSDVANAIVSTMETANAADNATNKEKTMSNVTSYHEVTVAAGGEETITWAESGSIGVAGYSAETLAVTYTGVDNETVTVTLYNGTDSDVTETISVSVIVYK